MKEIAINESQVDHSGIIDELLKDTSKLKKFSSETNVYFPRYNCLFKEAISFAYQGKTYIRVVFHHYMRRHIKKIAICLIAEYGENKNVLKTTLDEDWEKDNDYYSYATTFREGVELECISNIEDYKSDNQIDWICDKSFKSPFKLCFLGILEEKSNNYYTTTKFEYLSDDQVIELEKPKSKPEKKTGDLQSSSKYEQAIYYYVRQFFPDAINRHKLIDNDGVVHEVDVFVPSIRVGIEYDGKPWHSKSARRKIDEEKNASLNDMGVYVIRVRDEGLPKLSPFNGVVFEHGRNSLHTNQFVEKIMHVLADFVPHYPELRTRLLNFQLSYRENLENNAKIMAPLFIEKKSPNFASHPAFKYWDFDKNGDLNPECLQYDSNVFVNFICPAGKALCENLQLIISPFSNSFESVDSYNHSLFGICPFSPCHDYLSHSVNCLEKCEYVSSRAHEILRSFILDGIPTNDLDGFTKHYIRFRPKLCLEAIKLYIVANDEGKKRFNCAFLSYNHYLSTTGFWLRNLEVEDEMDSHYIDEYNDEITKYGFKYVKNDNIYVIKSLKELSLENRAPNNNLKKLVGGSEVLTFHIPEDEFEIAG